MEPMHARHPLRDLLERAARGHPPPADGSVAVLPSPPGHADAVVAFTAHHVVAAAVDPEAVRQRLGGADLGAPMGASFLAWLGEQLRAEPGSLDVVLVAAGRGSPSVELRSVSAADHARVARAERYRSEVRAWTDAEERGVVTLGRGLAGRLEVSVELDPSARGRGIGRRMIAAALALVPSGERVFAQAAPGNAASLRAFLAAGFVPIGAEVLFLRGR
ncbi:MAG TPA: GNAT family N-acetyltransferase [Candidatus Limnocylindria bacterium]|nr:GNAT family N-acetyltransferase [Candidatus Limnocylindria bacterium]